MKRCRAGLWLSALVVVGLILALPGVGADKPIKVLFLTKSSGFQHDVVKRTGDQLSFAEKAMVEMGKKNGLEVECTKDGGAISAENLKKFDVVQFYTTGDLTQPGKEDKSAPMAPEGKQALIDWVKNGGGFAGMHTASDTFHGWTPYLEMVGAEFAWHKSQQEGKLTVVKEHPITSHIGKEWNIQDEWYFFKNLSKTFTPLLVIDTKSMKEAEYKAENPYPVTWISEFGKGKVFVTALGHREDVWTNPKFQEMLIKGIKWSVNKLK